jgi:putative SOS response-associated peptidase YedK
VEGQENGGARQKRTIITCPPNALIGTLHDRMPVILAEEDWAKWLGEEPATSDELKALLVRRGEGTQRLLLLIPTTCGPPSNIRIREAKVSWNYKGSN